MSGEKLNETSDGGGAATGWESVAALGRYRDSEKVNQPAKSTTIGSAIQNAGDRVSTNARQFLEGWYARNAKKTAEQSAEKMKNAQDKTEADNDAYNEALGDFNNANEEHLKAEEHVSEVTTARQEKQNQLDAAKSEYSVGKYALTQAEQVGAILKAEGGVVKSALGVFSAKIISKMPSLDRIKSGLQYAFSSNEAASESNFNKDASKLGAEQRNAWAKSKGAMNAAQERFAKAKAARSEVVAGLSSNKETWQKGREEISESKVELADLKKELASAKQANRAAFESYQEAIVHRDEAAEQLEQSKAELEAATNKADQAAKKHEASRQKMERLEAMAKFQQEIGSKSPAKMRENIKQQMQDAQTAKDEKLDYILFSLRAESIDDLSDADRARAEKILERDTSKINSLESQLNALNQYEELRGAQIDKITVSSVVKKGLSGAFKGLRNALAATIH